MDIPIEFVCSISRDIFHDPVCTKDGQIYERACIEEWLTEKNTSPLTGKQLESKELIPIPFVKQQINAWLEKNNLITFDKMKHLISIGDIKTLETSKWIKTYISKQPSLLGIACAHNKIESVQWLLEKEADATSQDFVTGKTP